MTYFDGVLATLRLLQHSSLTAIMSHGEGCIIHVGVLSEDVRKACYKDRQVGEDEQQVLEQVALSLDHSILFSPMTMPKTQLANLRESVPELTVAIPHVSQIFVVIPDRDNGSEFHEVSQS